MNIIKRLFCCHFWIKPDMQDVRLTWNGLEFEWRCKKCNKLKYSKYRDVEPEPNFIYDANHKYK